jgi:hypothetical protein
LVFRYALAFSGEICQCSSDTDSGIWRSAYCVKRTRLLFPESRITS